MRIITGKAKGRRLITLEGEATRPTSEKVKEAVFSMLQFELEGRRALDLFGGSGQLALEALSRGAREAVAVDESREAVAIIRQNAERTGLGENLRVAQSSAKDYLRSAAGKEKFDVVFLDPPYARFDLLGDSLERLIAGDLLAKRALVVCETDRKDPVVFKGLKVLRHNKYGRVFITLLVKGAEEENGGES